MDSRATDTAVLHSYLSVVRRRLWLGEALAGAYRLLWYLGLFLCLLAVVHLAFSAVPDALVLSGVGSLIVLALIRALLRRPSLQTTAREADRAFGGHALMTTALEWLDKPAGAANFASALVLQQATDAARAWRARLSKLVRAPRAYKPVLAIIPVFMASVLLLLPGAERPGEVSISPDSKVSNDGAPAEARAPIGGDDVAALRGALNDRKAPRENANAAIPSDRTAKALVAAESTDTDSIVDAAVLPPEVAAGAGIAGRASADNEIPGDAAARTQLPPTDIADVIEFRGRETIDIERSADGDSAQAGPGSTYSDTPAANDVVSVNALPAAAPATNAQRTVLTPAQAAYARRYLATQGNSNE